MKHIIFMILIAVLMTSAYAQSGGETGDERARRSR